MDCGLFRFPEERDRTDLGGFGEGLEGFIRDFVDVSVLAEEDVVGSVTTSRWMIMPLQGAGSGLPK